MASLKLMPHTYPEADYYHFGFHSALSSFIWLTGYEIHDGMLIFGQVLNAMIVFAVYLLAKTLTKNRRAALTAALIAGVFTLDASLLPELGALYTIGRSYWYYPSSFRIFVEIIQDKKHSNQRSKSLGAEEGSICWIILDPLSGGSISWPFDTCLLCSHKSIHEDG